MRLVRALPHALGGACLLALAGLALPAHASVTWHVGAGSDCDTHSIQDAVDLAAQFGNGDQKFIDVASDQDYTGQSIHVDNQDLEFDGGRTACSSLFTSDPTVISGGSGPVFDISGTSHVVFRSFEIRDGNAFTGGGINVNGNGWIAVSDTLIDFNAATYGGGIAATSGGAVDVYINAGTQILRNTAVNAGGGVSLAGNAYLYAMQPDTLIAFNDVPNGNGGGIDATAPAKVTLGSPGYSGLPLVFANRAAYGGGISLTGPSTTQDFGSVRMFATNPGGAVAVSDNIGIVAGGGFYLLGTTGIGNTLMCAEDFQIDGNAAPQGAAIYLGWSTDDFGTDVGSGAYLNPDDGCDTEGLGAVRCAPGVACNEMSANEATDTGGSPSGATVFIGTTSYFSGQRVRMTGNVGTNLLLAQGDNDVPAGAFLKNCLTAGNQFSRELIRMQNDDNTLYIDSCTFAPDIINAAYLILFDNAGGNDLTMINTIVDEPGTLTLSQPGINQSIENILTNDDSTLPSRIDIIDGTPDFVDAANGDFRQQPHSLGVDWAIATGGIDLNGNRRDVDLPDTPNFFGPRDLGAYETQGVFACSVADTIFCDGFDGL